MAVEARYPGACPACDGTIHVGDAVKRDPLDGAGASWIHEQCPPSPAPRPICTECFMEVALNGECGCGVLV